MTRNEMLAKNVVVYPGMVKVTRFVFVDVGRNSLPPYDHCVSDISFLTVLSKQL